MNDATSHKTSVPGQLPLSFAANDVTAAAFVRRYPAAKIHVGEHVRRVAEILGEHYDAQGFAVRWSNDWDDALRRIEPGQVWLVWAPLQDFRVLGLLRPAKHARPSRDATAAFVRRLIRVGRSPRLGR
jgi:hypothetical protein